MAQDGSQYQRKPSKTTALRHAFLVRPLLTVQVMNAYAIAPSPQTKAGPIDLAGLIRAEYLEMPGLCLTLAQAVRLWNADRDQCLAVLESLKREGFLDYRRGLYFRVGMDTARD